MISRRRKVAAQQKNPETFAALQTKDTSQKDNDDRANPTVGLRSRKDSERLNDASQVSQENTLCLYASVFLLLIGLCVILINIHEVRLLASSLVSPRSHSNPVVWIHKGRLSSFSPLFHVERTLSRLGFIIARDEEPAKWDFFWSHEYPYDDDAPLPVTGRWLEDHQMVNKIPGIGHVTSKLALSGAFNASFLPPSFVIPQQQDQLINFSLSHHSARWLEKSVTHRGIVLKSLDEAIRHSGNQRIVQQYVEDPILIDNRKFDIGVYAVITELRPLRVYVYEGNILLRFCRRNYDPKINDTERYVIADYYTSAWDIPSIRPLLSSGLSYKDALAVFLNRRGVSFPELWKKFRYIVADVMVRKVSSMLLARRKLRAPIGSVFELVRFDFLLDNHLRTYLLEINMSPNMASDGKPRNGPLYEAILRDTFSLVGLEKKEEVENWEMAVNVEECATHRCTACSLSQCRVCLHCLEENDRSLLRASVREHNNRRYMRRVLPQPASDNPVQEPDSEEDKLLRTWLTAKCQDDSAWCR